MSPLEMRRQRVKDIVTKHGFQTDCPQVASQPHLVPSKDDEDDGRFVSKYFDSVANKQYQ